MTKIVLWMETNVKVIGAGWGRTGTHSFKNAMEILGMKCYHMVCLFYKSSSFSFECHMFLLCEG